MVDAAQPAPPLVEINGLKTYFETETGVVKAVDDISLEIHPGRTLGVVGESGSGKSVTAFSLLRLLASNADVVGGSVLFRGRNMLEIPEPELRAIRGGEISMIFQEPMTSLNPVISVGRQVMEAVLLHERISKRAARERTIDLFQQVGMPDPEQRVDSYPHQLSGGQKQRVMIAMALSCNPSLLIADEPTTALDVTIQAQILDIMRRLRDQRQMAVLFITHDLGVIAEIADDVAVMYRGKVVEQGTVLDIFEKPQHPYTKGLLACRPHPGSENRRLATVEDFMETVEVDGRIEVREKKVDDATLQRLAHTGRGRLLHPKPMIETMDADANSVPPDATFIDAGTEPLLHVRDLEVHFPIRRGFFLRTVGHVRAVDGVSFDVFRGQTLGLVGESGCGKTTAGRAILRLIEPTAGRVTYDGVDLTALPRRGLRAFRRRLQIIFQDPYGSLNPRTTVETALVVPMAIHGLGSSRADRRERAAQLLREVGLESDHLRRYPHEFSGGQRQRICIARALAVEPEFVICDESVSALDVSVQAQVLNLLKDLQEKRDLTYIFISHDLSVVKFMADMMLVMNEGKIVEAGPSDAIYSSPRQDYTRRLIAATPDDRLENIRRRQEARRAARSAQAAD